MTNLRSWGSQSMPTVVKNIIIINVLMVLLQMALAQRGINLADYLGLHYYSSEKFRWWQFLTHVFMHGDYKDISMTITHIFFNMYGVYMFGTVLEQIWGPKRFLIFYLICGIGAGFCYMGVLQLQYANLHHVIVNFEQHPTFVEYGQLVRHHNLANIPYFKEILTFWGQHADCEDCASMAAKGLNQYYTEITNIQMVGASGAVFGILFAFGYLFPNTELMIMFIPVPIKAKWLIGGYALVELFLGFGQFQGDDVAHFAHIGGMIFAFILLRIWKTNRANFY